MKATCPSCGAEMSMDVLLAHQDSSQALARLLALSVPLGKAVLQYLRLFNPGTRKMSHSRMVALVEELLPDIERGAVARNGREWAAPREVWSQAFAKMLEARDAGKLTLPLKTHGYLYEVIAGLADKAEAVTERERENGRRTRSVAGPATELQPLAALIAAQSTAPAPPPPAYTGPSRAALKIKAEIEARKARRAGGDADPPGEPMP